MRTLVVIGMIVALRVGSVGAGRLTQTTTTWFQAELSGAPEVPGPGDPDGTGDLRLDFDSPPPQSLRFDSPTSLRFTLTMSGITLPAAAAHIHRGVAGEAGPAVVPFPVAPGADGRATGTIMGPADIMTAMVNDASAFYVNVHTTDYPNGAVRGQLRLLAIGGGEEGELPEPGLPAAGRTGDTSPVLMRVALLALVAGLVARRYALAQERRAPWQ